jgi:hypothetical protein
MATIGMKRYLAVVVTLGMATSGALAQAYPFGVNPFFRIRPNLTIGQAAYNTALMGQALSSVPPWAFRNPYPYPGIASGLGASPAYGYPYPAALTGGTYGNPYAASLTSTPYLPTNTGYGATGASLYSDPYGGGAGYGGYGYGESPLGGFLRGAADVTNAEGRMLIQIQQARLLKQQVAREKVENRRRIFDNWLYEREKTPTAEDDRQKDLEIQLRRSLNDPPVGEVWSGQALNTLLTDIQKKLGKDNRTDIQGPPINLDDDTLRHLNVTGFQGKGNPGLLKNEGRLNWPLALRGPQFKAERELLNDLAPSVYDQAIAGRVDGTTLESMTNAVKKLSQTLAENIKDLTPAHYSEARRFLSNFDDALALLRQPGAGDYFTQKAPKGKTILDLVQHMSSKGLQFAPATAGDEPAYVAVHRALAALASAANAQVAAEKPERSNSRTPAP